MTDEGPYTPPPSSAPPPPPPPAPQYAAPAVPSGVAPERLDGPFYSTGLVILLTVVTCGVWAAIWTYRTKEDLKRFNGDGLGGVLGVVIYLLLSPVLMFTIPSEIQKAYQRMGRESPVEPLWGLWFLLPLIGNIIWYVRVQQALNDLWIANGARQD